MNNMMVCGWARDRVRDYDSLQSVAVLLLYIQIGCGVIGCVGASYNGVAAMNASVALFALVAIESSSQRLGRIYATLLLACILIDLLWLFLFAHSIWSVLTLTLFLSHMFLQLLLNSRHALSGECVHAHALKTGHLSCLSVSKPLLNFYAKRGGRDSHRLFAQIGNRSDAVLWNILISDRSAAAVKVLREMLRCGEARPNPITMATVCSRAPHARAAQCVHCHSLKCGLHAHNLVGNALVSAYASFGLPDPDAYAAFADILTKDVVSWNAIIAAFRQNGFQKHAFSLFLRMTTPLNHVTVATVLPLCAYRFGKQIHAYVLHRPEMAHDVFVCNSLLSFYLRLGNAEEAEFLFDRMESRDLVSWNAIISGYVSNAQWLKAMQVFRRLVAVADPDSVTIVSTLPACAHLRYPRVAKMIHAYALRRPVLRDDTAVGNSIITFYAKCKDVFAAYQTFSVMPNRDLISWNSMLDCFAQSGTRAEFTNLLAKIFAQRIRPDSVTLLIIVRFCIGVSEIDKVKEAHGYSIRAGFLPGNAEPTIGNAILDAYAKCGEMESAHTVFRSLSGKTNLVTFNSMISGFVNSGSPEEARMLFNKMPERDLTTWNLMIRVYAEKGVIEQALQLLHELQGRAMRPDSVTIMSLIPVCVHTCSVLLVRQCHAYVVRACFDDLRLTGALLDAYAKCGALSSAHAIYLSNPQRDLVMFTAMIGGFAMHGRGEEALGIFRNLLETGLKPDHVILTTLLSACSHAGLVSQGLEIFRSIEKVHRTVEQQCCAVDLLARSGRVEEALSVAEGGNASVWGALLGACNTHHNVELGRVAAHKLFEMEPDDVGSYVAMANLYASNARWDRSLELRRLMRTRDVHKPAGCSWIETETTTNVFVAGDSSHPARLAIYATLRTLDKQIKGSL